MTLNIVYKLMRPVRVPAQNNAFEEGEVTLQRSWPISIEKIDAGARDPFTFYVHKLLPRQIRLRAVPDDGAGSPEAVRW